MRVSSRPFPADRAARRRRRINSTLVEGGCGGAEEEQQSVDVEEKKKACKEEKGATEKKSARRPVGFVVLSDAERAREKVLSREKDGEDCLDCNRKRGEDLVGARSAPSLKFGWLSRAASLFLSPRRLRKGGRKGGRESEERRREG